MRIRLLCSAILLAITPVLGSPQAGRAAFTEGRRLMDINEPAKAETQFERAIALEPGVSEYHLWLGNAVGQQAQNANVLRQPFLARRVKAEFERAVELDPRNIEARDGLLGFYLQAPAVMGGGIDKAREQAREIARLNAVQGLMATARIAWYDKDTVATEGAWRAAIAAIPDSADPVINLASRLQAWGRPGDAFAAYDAFLVRQPRNAPVRFQWSRLAAIEGDRLPAAERHLRALLADDAWFTSGQFPTRSAILARLGDVLRKQGKTAEARTAYQEALRLDKDSQIAKDGLRALN